MHSMTYHVQCNPSQDISGNRENYYLILKRGLNDQRPQDVKQNFRRFVFLINKHNKPMLFISKELIPQNESYHIIRLNKDPEYSHITIRITSQKPFNGMQTVKVHVLDLVDCKLPHDRYLQLKKLSVLHQLDINLHIASKDRKCQINYQQPLDLSLLSIYRKQSMRTGLTQGFVICYNHPDSKMYSTSLGNTSVLPSRHSTSSKQVCFLAYMERELQKSQDHSKRGNYEGGTSYDKKRHDEKQFSQLTSSVMLQTMKPNLLHQNIFRRPLPKHSMQNFIELNPIV